MIVLEHWLASLIFKLCVVLLAIYIATGVLQWWLGRKLHALQNTKATLLEIRGGRRR